MCWNVHCLGCGVNELYPSMVSHCHLDRREGQAQGGPRRMRRSAVGLCLTQASLHQPPLQSCSPKLLTLSLQFAS